MSGFSTVYEFEAAGGVLPLEKWEQKNETQGKKTL